MLLTDTYRFPPLPGGVADIIANKGFPDEFVYGVPITRLPLTSVIVLKKACVGTGCDDQTAPSLVRTFPGVPGATTFSGLVPFPNNTLLTAKEVAPVPPELGYKGVAVRKRDGAATTVPLKVNKDDPAKVPALLN